MKYELEKQTMKLIPENSLDCFKLGKLSKIINGKENCTLSSVNHLNEIRSFEFNIQKAFNKILELSNEK